MRVKVQLKFKDGEVISAYLEPHVLDLWENDKKTKGALRKFGELVKPKGDE